MNIPAFLEGNLVKDPEIKYTKDGKPWARMRVAVEEREFVDGEWRDAPASFHDVNAFGHVAKQAERLEKGDRIVAAGEMQIREYVDADPTPLGTVHVDGAVWRAFRDDGGDRALVRRDGEVTTVVVGSVSADQLLDYLRLLT